MILVPFIIFFVMILAKIQKGVFASFLVLVATKSIVDAFWSYSVGPLSILAIQGVLIPLLYWDLIANAKLIPKFWLRTGKIYVIALAFGIIWAVLAKPINFVENAIINVNIYLGFILIPLLVYDQKRLKQFLLAIMISGVFPVLVSLFQLQTGIVFVERETVGLTRYVGFYHDAFPTRFYGLMSLMAILLYQSVFKIKNIYFKLFVAFLAAGAFISIYAVYSKAGIGILGLWVVLLLLFSKSKTKQIFSIVVGISVLLLVFGDVFVSNIEQLFSKEVGYQTGEVKDARYTLAGRGYIWEEHWGFWVSEQTFFYQWFGDGLIRPVHNEFLRVLMLNGIIGVIFLVIFIITNIGNVFKVYKNIRVFAIMLLGMYVADSIGLVPGRYYYYNILVWGIFGALLLRPQLFIRNTIV